MKQIKYLHLANFQHLNFLLGSSLSKVKKSITTSINLKIGVQVKKKKKKKVFGFYLSFCIFNSFTLYNSIHTRSNISLKIQVYISF